MHYKIYLLIPIILLSCADKKEKFNYETSIASKVYQAQLQYLDNTIFNYARNTEQGNYFYQESNFLDKSTEELKNKLKNGNALTDEDKIKFYTHFEKTFSTNGLIDLEILKEIKNLPIKTSSDIDLLKLYIKNNFVCILLNNKLLPYDTWGTMAAADKWTIDNGEEFEVFLSNTAWNSSLPNEWFLVKNEDDSLTNQNIIDTLHQDETGMVHFKTKSYKKGENVLTFVSKLNTPDRNRTLSKQVVFNVK